MALSRLNSRGIKNRNASLNFKDDNPFRALSKLTVVKNSVTSYVGGKEADKCSVH